VELLPAVSEAVFDELDFPLRSPATTLTAIAEPFGRRFRGGAAASTV